MSTLPPGPKLPAAVQLARWVRTPTEFLEECARKYGDAFTLRMPGNPPMVLFSHPNALKEIFTGDPEIFHAGEANRIVEGFLGANSLLILDGKRHLRERKLMMPPFHGERMQAYGAIMRDLTDRSIARWPVGTPFPLHPEMQRITLEVIVRTVFGVEDGARMAHLHDLLVRVTEGSQGPVLLAMLMVLKGRKTRQLLEYALAPVKILGRELSLAPLIPWRGVAEAVKETDDYLYAEFRRRREAGLEGSQDVLGMLLATRDEEDKPMTDEELRDEMVTLLAAGHETTAISLSWAFHHLTGAPETYEKLVAELDRVVGEGPLEPHHIPKLELVDATVKETLRLTPVLPAVARTLQQPTTIAGWDLPKGAVVIPSIYLTHRRPEIWAVPHRFWPDRFLTKRQPSPYELLPFGGGVRRCIGAAFALYEMKIVLAEVLRKVRVKAAPGSKVRLVRRGITFAPSEGVPVVIERR
jgi:cytochrome P450 family 110